ncbi:MAG: M50 family peptidase [Oxalobacteraceae bacterium]|nr:MAG: M50 family peptidase [Oxalobacteraceae bacterium]
MKRCVHTHSSYRVIGLLDGDRTLQQVWGRLSAAMDEHTPSQDELVQLFGQLYAADLIQCDVTPDVAELFERGGKQRRSKLLQRFANPVSLRFPLVDPDAWLGRVIARAGPLKGWVGIALWLAVVLPAVLLAPSHWRELTGNINERLLAVDNLVLLAILFPLLKAAHEIGHGLAAKRFGGEVHEMGVMLLVFFPVPYVDASSSSAFESRWPRMLVGAAGMLTELFIAAVAFFLWLALEPGFARSLAFNVIVLASMTTLMFNANGTVTNNSTSVTACTNSTISKQLVSTFFGASTSYTETDNQLTIRGPQTVTANKTVTNSTATLVTSLSVNPGGQPTPTSYTLVLTKQ